MESIVTYAIKHQERNQFIHTKHTLKKPPIMQLLLLKLLQSSTIETQFRPSQHRCFVITNVGWLLNFLIMR